MLQEKLHFGRVLSVFIFVDMINGGGICLRPIIKVNLLVACVFVYSRDSMRQRT